MVLGLIVLVSFLAGCVFFVAFARHALKEDVNIYLNKLNYLVSVRKFDVLLNPQSDECAGLKALEKKFNHRFSIFKGWALVIQVLYILAVAGSLVVSVVSVSWLVPIQIPEFAVYALLGIVFFGCAFILGAWTNRRLG